MKKVVAIHQKTAQHWVGDAFKVQSFFSYGSRSIGSRISPFLLLDYAEPNAFEAKPSQVTEQHGVGEHPHRGFETVTVVYQGEIEHRDSAGNSGKIGPGDVQWMTAASGVVHEEKLSEAFERTGGVLENAQLWVNLPSNFKMTKPRYQEILSNQIGVVQLPNDAGYLRVIAGEYDGIKGPALTFTPVDLWDVHLKAGTSVKIELDEGRTVLLPILRGKVKVGDTETIENGQTGLLSSEGADITIEALEDTTLLVLSGEPIEEPIAGYGPFVMNTREEIQQAMIDYQDGKMGQISE